MNWIGYTPQYSLDINTALDNIGDGNGSYIKSQEARDKFNNKYLAKIRRLAEKKKQNPKVPKLKKQSSKNKTGQSGHSH